YLNFVWRNWIFIASVTAFALLVGVVYLVWATPLYTATTQVLLVQNEKAPALDAVGNERGMSFDYYAENQLAVLRSDSLLRRVTIKELVPPSKSRATVQSTEDQATAETAINDGINRLRGALAVTRSGRAQVLNIAITWDDPVRAGQLANAVADAY